MNFFEALTLSYRDSGFYLFGKLESPPSGLSGVNTKERDEVRASVLVHASRTNYSGEQNLFLTAQREDLPTPAGRAPWIL